jgi:hypothetical protein
MLVFVDEAGDVGFKFSQNENPHLLSQMSLGKPPTVTDRSVGQFQLRVPTSYPKRLWESHHTVTVRKWGNSSCASPRPIPNIFGKATYGDRSERGAHLKRL